MVLDFFVAAFFCVTAGAPLVAGAPATSGLSTTFQLAVEKLPAACDSPAKFSTVRKCYDLRKAVGRGTCAVVQQALGSPSSPSAPSSPSSLVNSTSSQGSGTNGLIRCTGDTSNTAAEVLNVTNARVRVRFHAVYPVWGSSFPTGTGQGGQAQAQTVLDSLNGSSASASINSEIGSDRLVGSINSEIANHHPVLAQQKCQVAWDDNFSESIVFSGTDLDLSSQGLAVVASQLGLHTLATALAETNATLLAETNKSTTATLLAGFGVTAPPGVSKEPAPFITRSKWRSSPSSTAGSSSISSAGGPDREWLFSAQDLGRCLPPGERRGFDADSLLPEMRIGIGGSGKTSQAVAAYFYAIVVSELLGQRVRLTEEVPANETSGANGGNSSNGSTENSSNGSTANSSNGTNSTTSTSNGTNSSNSSNASTQAAEQAAAREAAAREATLAAREAVLEAAYRVAAIPEGWSQADGLVDMDVESIVSPLDSLRFSKYVRVQKLFQYLGNTGYPAWSELSGRGGGFFGLLSCMGGDSRSSSRVHRASPNSSLFLQRMSSRSFRRVILVLREQCASSLYSARRTAVLLSTPREGLRLSGPTS